MRRRAVAARAARLATVGPDGKPHLVVMTFAMEGDVLYSAVDSKPKRTRDLKRLRNIAAHPAVSVLIDDYDEEWSRLWWCRLDGTARITEGGRSFEDGLRALSDKYEQYRERPPEGPVIVMDVTSWTGWAASTPKGDG